MFQSFRWSSLDSVSNRTSNPKRSLTSCSERVKHIIPKNVYQILETLFDKLNSFEIQYTKEQTLLKTLVVFHFESNCVQGDIFKDTDTTEGIGKHFPISISISSKPVEHSIILCNADPYYLVASFIATLENLAFHSKIQLKTLFFDFETGMKIRLKRYLKTSSHRHNRRR